MPTPIQLLDSLANQARALPILDEDVLDSLLIRAKMLVREIFGEKSPHLKSLTNEGFFVMSFGDVTEHEQQAQWESGLKRLLALVETMKEEYTLRSARLKVTTAERATSDRHETKPEPSGHTDTVMVVHGRNDKIRRAMFDFLRSIRLNPVEWSKAIAHVEKGSPYIGEVLDAAFSMSQAVIVLLTGDDDARLRTEFQRPDDPAYETNLTPQARPNVLFEAGMAMGRDAARTVIVQVGYVRPFSDIQGRHVIHLDDSSEKRSELAERLRTAGCTVDTVGTDWHHAGQFMSAVREPQPPRDARDSYSSASLGVSGEVMKFEVLDARDLSPTEFKELEQEFRQAAGGVNYISWLQVTTRTLPARTSEWRFSVGRKDGTRLQCPFVAKTWGAPKSWPDIRYDRLEPVRNEYLRPNTIYNILLHVKLHALVAQLDMRSFEGSFAVGDDGELVTCRMSGRGRSAEDIFGEIPGTLTLTQRAQALAGAAREALVVYHGKVDADAMADEEVRKAFGRRLPATIDLLESSLGRDGIVSNIRNEGMLTVRNVAKLADYLEIASSKL